MCFVVVVCACLRGQRFTLPRSLAGEFDEIYVAPVFGFDGFQDYYRKTQSGQFLKGVRVPLLAVQARNDPFMNPDKLPTVDDLEGAPVRLSYHEV